MMAPAEHEPPGTGQDMLSSSRIQNSRQVERLIHMPDWVWVTLVFLPLALLVFVAQRRAGNSSRDRGAHATTNRSTPHHIATIVVKNAGSDSDEADTISGIGAVSSSGFAA